MLGWCMTGHHEDHEGPGRACPGIVENTLTRKVAVCNCPRCHGNGGQSAEEQTVPEGSD